MQIVQAIHDLGTDVGEVLWRHTITSQALFQLGQATQVHELQRHMHHTGPLRQKASDEISGACGC